MREMVIIRAMELHGCGNATDLLKRGNNRAG